MNDLTTYYKVRDLMRTGDQLAFASAGLIGKIIMFRSGKYSHWGGIIRLQEYEGLERKRFTIEAIEHGFYPDILSNYIKNYKGHIWWYPLRDEWNPRRHALGERALALIGTPYDYKSLFKQAIARVSTDAKKLFCSEAWYYIMGFTGKAPYPSEMPNLGVFKEPVQLV